MTHTYLAGCQLQRRNRIAQPFAFNCWLRVHFAWLAAPVLGSDADSRLRTPVYRLYDCNLMTQLAVIAAVGSWLFTTVIGTHTSSL